MGFPSSRISCKKRPWDSTPSSPVKTEEEEEEEKEEEGEEDGILLQPETRPITQAQLVNEVKGKFLLS